MERSKICFKDKLPLIIVIASTKLSPFCDDIAGPSMFLFNLFLLFKF